MDQPPYLRIAREIERRIESGALVPGDRAPSTRQIMRKWRVAMATATKVLAVLTRAGWVQPVRGSGTVVAHRRKKPEPRPRGRRDAGALTQDRVVRAAIKIADAEGLNAVSMRRIAAELGVAAMALYRHVPSRDELLLQMAEMTFGTVPLPARLRSPWRAQLEAIARLQWALYKEHPWLAQVITLSFTRPILSPAGMRHTERILRAIDGFGLDNHTRLYAVLTLAGYVQGIALKLIAETDAQHETGLDPDQWMETQSDALDAVLATGEFPMIAKLGEHGGVDIDLDALFDLGLRVVLDGLAALFAHATRRRR